MSGPPTPQSRHDFFAFIYDNKMLSETDATRLWEAGLLQTDPQLITSSKYIRIHKRRLDVLSDTEFSHFPLPVEPQPSSSVNSNNDNDDDDPFVTIPAQLRSMETLVYVGYTETEAARIWKKWMSWEGMRDVDDDMLTFLDAIIGHLESGEDTDSEDDQRWVELMTRWGLSASFQQGIMHPAFRYLRTSESCLYWVLDTLKMRYEGLDLIQRTSRQRAECIPSGPTIRWNHECEYAAGLRLNTTSMSSISQCAQGSIKLYQARYLAGIHNLFDSQGDWDNVGHIANGKCPSDFAAGHRNSYFTPSLEIAQADARYHKHRSPAQSVMIISIEIPNAAIESLAKPEILRINWGDPEWRDVVWNCRRRGLPRHLRIYSDATLIIGTVARRPDLTYNNMSSADKIGEDCVLRIDGDGLYKPSNPPAIQYVFGCDEGLYFLKENVQNIRVAICKRADLDIWLTTRSILDVLRG